MVVAKFRIVVVVIVVVIVVVVMFIEEMIWVMDFG
jgi:hypothetical protein